jgi:hypothetical protein
MDQMRAYKLNTKHHTVAWSARLRTPASSHVGQLVDLSQTGAKLELDVLPRIGATAILQWSSEGCFCKVVRANGSLCEVTFETPIRHEVLIATTGTRSECNDSTLDVQRIPAGRRRSQRLPIEDF